jgi:hypothetical protein
MKTYSIPALQLKGLLLLAQVGKETGRSIDTIFNDVADALTEQEGQVFTKEGLLTIIEAVLLAKDVGSTTEHILDSMAKAWDLTENGITPKYISLGKANG